MNKWAQLCSNKTLFAKMGRGLLASALDSDCRCPWEQDSGRGSVAHWNFYKDV